nr:serine hydrolase [Auraticoccus monumenti]
MGLVSDYSDGTPVVAFQVARADGRVLASRQPDREFYAASTVKLAVLAAAARALQHGSATLDEPLVSRDTFESQVAGEPPYRLVPDDVDAGMAPPGTTMPLSEVVERMIVVSSNEATNMVVERLGLTSVARVLADAGADGVRMGRPFGDRAAGPARRAGQRRHGRWAGAADVGRGHRPVVRPALDRLDDRRAVPAGAPAADRRRARRCGPGQQVRHGHRHPPRRRLRRRARPRHPGGGRLHQRDR